MSSTYLQKHDILQVEIDVLLFEDSDFFLLPIKDRNCGFDTSGALLGGSLFEDDL